MHFISTFLLNPSPPLSSPHSPFFCPHQPIRYRSPGRIHLHKAAGGGPGRVEGNERESAREREGESRDAMVLIGLGVGWACKRWMHTPDHSFEGQHVEKMENSMSQGSAGPSKHFLFGFRDRDLEDEYLDYLMRESRVRIYLGYVVMLLLIIFGSGVQVAGVIFLLVGASKAPDASMYEDSIRQNLLQGFALFAVGFAIPIVGLLASWLVYR